MEQLLFLKIQIDLCHLVLSPIQLLNLIPEITFKACYSADLNPISQLKQ